MASSSMFTALSGEEGLTAGSAAGTWAALLASLAGRTAAVGEVLAARVVAYRAEDAAPAGRVGRPLGHRMGAGW